MLQADTRYSFQVNGISEDGLRSLNVPRQSVTLLTTGGPFAPATVGAFAYGPATLEIIWPRKDSGETYAVGYDVLRDCELIATLDALSLMDTEQSPGTTYNYSVRSFAQDGRRSDTTVSAAVTTPMM